MRCVRKLINKSICNICNKLCGYTQKKKNINSGHNEIQHETNDSLFILYFVLLITI